MDRGVKLVTRKYNPTRQRQNDVVNKISHMLQIRDIRSDSHPLMAAVDKSEIDVRYLSTTYDTVQHTPNLSPLKTNVPEATLFLLAGFHRFAAVKHAIGQLRKRSEGLEDQVEKLNGPRLEDEDGNEIGGRDETSIGILEVEIKHIAETVERIKFWPVMLYDLGKSGSSAQAPG